MVEELRVLVAVGLLMLLVLLRLDAERFGAAEFVEPFDGPPTRWFLRLTWYGLGLALIVAIFYIHPFPHDQLRLQAGPRMDALFYAVAISMLGIGQAIAFALFRYHEIHPPLARTYPNATLNVIGTAFVDEATFRGILLGMLIVAGVPEGLAVVLQAVIYALATRMGARGRHPYMLLLNLGIGLVGGWATVKTGGLAAAIVGHAFTRFALFLCTGHPGHVTRRGTDKDETERDRRPPDGWRDARGRERASTWSDARLDRAQTALAEPLPFADPRPASNPRPANYPGPVAGPRPPAANPRPTLDRAPLGDTQPPSDARRVRDPREPGSLRGGVRPRLDDLDDLDDAERGGEAP